MPKKNKIFQSLVAFCFICLLISMTSCYPEFRNSLPRETEKLDVRLLGNWIRIMEGGEMQQLSIFPRSNNWFDIFYIYHINSDMTLDGANMIALEGYTTEVQGVNCLCMRFREKDVSCWKQTNKFDYYDKETGENSFFIVLYQLNNRELHIQTLSPEKVKELVVTGMLEGEIIDGKVPGEFKRIVVTSSSEELQKFFSEEGVQPFLANGKDKPVLLDEKIVFTKVGL